MECYFIRLLEKQFVVAYGEVAKYKSLPVDFKPTLYFWILSTLADLRVSLIPENEQPTTASGPDEQERKESQR